jgi:hypothetical protein
MAGGESLGDEVRLVPRVQLVAEIFDMTLNRTGSDPQLESALLRGQPSRDAVQDFALSL